MLFEEAAPAIIQFCTVGLDGVVNCYARADILLHQFHGILEEFQPHQGRLAALPGDGHLGGILRLDDALDVGLQHIVFHAEGAAWVERLLGQEETVLAVQIADGTGRFGHHVEVIRGVLRRDSGIVSSSKGALSFMQSTLIIL